MHCTTHQHDPSGLPKYTPEPSSTTIAHAIGSTGVKNIRPDIDRVCVLIHSIRRVARSRSCGVCEIVGRRRQSYGADYTNKNQDGFFHKVWFRLIRNKQNRQHWYLAVEVQWHNYHGLNTPLSGGHHIQALSNNQGMLLISLG